MEAATKTRDAKVVQLLNEAYGKERQLELSRLESHMAMTTRTDYEKRLRQHLKETKSHASTVAKRIKQLGGTAETVSLPGPEGATKAAQSLQGAVGKAKAAAQGPLHLAKGSGEQEEDASQRSRGIPRGGRGDRHLHRDRRARHVGGGQADGEARSRHPQ